MSPFLLALGNREELVRNGKLTSIIFVRDVNSKGQEVSGYIDYAHRLRSTNFEPYFERRKKVGMLATTPRPGLDITEACSNQGQIPPLIYTILLLILLLYQKLRHFPGCKRQKITKTPTAKDNAWPGL